MRRLAALLVLPGSLTAAGCGGVSADRQHAARPAVRAVVDLSRPRSGPPDAGVARGHGADLALATTHRASLRIHGSVTPHGSAVVLKRLPTGYGSPGRVGPGGRFTVVARGLHAGSNTFLLEARRPGFAPWRLQIRITRR